MVSVVSERIPMLQSAPATSFPFGIGIDWRAVTHRGLVRMRNEDSLCVETEAKNEQRARYLIAIADGLGGHRGGAFASQTAIKVLQDEFHEWHGRFADSFVARSIRNVNEVIFSYAQTRSDLVNMQTTLTAVVLEQNSIAVGHVGDCRLYRVRNGRIKLLTRDHSIANDLLKLRLTSTEKASEHPGRHQLTRSIGANPFLRLDLVRGQLVAGDTFLLCSDGLWSEVPSEVIRMALASNDISAAFEDLVGTAFDAGAPDNISAIIFRVIGVGSPAASSFVGRKARGGNN